MNAEPLWRWVDERHVVFLRKCLLEGVEAPRWADPLGLALLTSRTDPRRPPSYEALTKDPVLRTYRFCNVFRELDRVTVWVRENIREPYADHPHLWFMLCVARYINWPPTLQCLIQSPDAWPTDARFSLERLTWVLDDLMATGNKVYTGAYMIRAESNPNAPWYSWTKQRYVAEVVLGRLWEDRDLWRRYLENRYPAPDLQTTWAKFQDPRYIGWGPFMAYEVVTDLRHTRYLERADDVFSWANAGPGALRGLNRLRGRELSTPLAQREANDLMRELLAQSREATGRHVPDMEMRDVEHSLCEVDKYLRAAGGEGRPRSRYVPGRGW